MDPSTFPTTGEPPALAPDALVGAAASARRWRPGLKSHPLHSEIFAPGGEGSGGALALALALDMLRVEAEAAEEEARSGRSPKSREVLEQRSVLWVQDRAALRLTGRPYRPGLPPMLRRRLIHVAAETPEDTLFALEEGVRCRDLACVIGEIAGNPKALDFTASRRLTLTAERHNVPLFLVRLDAAPDLSSARMRWRVQAAASPSPLWNAAAPGPASWQAELFRARAHPPGTWTLREEGDTLHALAASGEGKVAADTHIRSA